MISHPPSALDRRFAGVINQLFAAIGACQFSGRLTGPVILLICRRLHSLRARFYALFARVAAGKLPAAPRKPRTPRREGEPATPRKVDPLPRTVGWLVQLVPEARGARGLLQFLVQAPEMAEFLSTAPQAGRIIRPLCRMLRIPLPPVLALPKRPAKPPPKPSPARPAAKPPRPPLGRTFPSLDPPRRKRRAPRAIGPPPFPA